jgi:protein-disulfide isomerase
VRGALHGAVRLQYRGVTLVNGDLRRPKGPLWRHLLDCTASVAMIAASVLVIRAVWHRPAPDPSDLAQRLVPVEPVALGGDVRRHGDPRLVLMVYSDFQCRYCAGFSLTVLPRLVEQFEQHGVLAIAFKHFPLEEVHPSALRSAIAAECAASEGRFWEMHDSLFSAPSDGTDADLLHRAGSLGLDPSRFGRCVRDTGTANKVRRDAAEGRRLGVNATPTLFLGVVQGDANLHVMRRWSGLTSFEEIAAAIEAIAKTRVERLEGSQ